VRRTICFSKANGVALAEALATVSHDRLTRLLQGDWSGQRLLELACRTLSVWDKGYLIIDDTVIPKPFATAIEGLAWVFSSVERKPVYGLSLVLLVWTNGTRRIPLGMRLWHKGAHRNTRSPWNSSAMPVIACAAALSTCSLTPGTPPKPSSRPSESEAGSCTSILRIIPMTSKPGKMPCSQNI
jgi:hypothetical protein